MRRDFEYSVEISDMFGRLHPPYILITANSSRPD